jgi:ribosome-binding protein aMBF1 (putative translation factor)
VKLFWDKFSRYFKPPAAGFARRSFAKQPASKTHSFSWGRIALLGLTQRQIRVSRAHIPPNRQRRKPIPTAIQTPGDYIQAKRYEKGLHPYQVAGKMGIATSLVSAWERGTSTPDEKQWQMLSNLLSFVSGVDLPKPHR